MFASTGSLGGGGSSGRTSVGHGGRVECPLRVRVGREERSASQRCRWGRNGLYGVVLSTSQRSRERAVGLLG